MTIVELDERVASQAAAPDRRKESTLDVSDDSYSVPNNENFRDTCACIRTPSKSEECDLGSDQVLWADVRKYLKGNPDVVQSLKTIAARRKAEALFRMSSCGPAATASKSPCKAERLVSARSTVPRECERNWANRLLAKPTDENSVCINGNATRNLGACLSELIDEERTNRPTRKSTNVFPSPQPGQVFSLDALSAATYVEQGSEVILQVYDFTNWTKASNLPIYHLGVQVYRLEYFFCSRGIQSCIPMSNKGHIFRQSVPLGKSSMSLKEVRLLLHKIRTYWCADSYRMLGRNCQTFALAFCEELGLMKSVPPEYSRFSDLGDLRAGVAGLVDGATSLMPRLPEGPTLLGACSVSELGRTDVCGTRSRLRPCIPRNSTMPCGKSADATVDTSPNTNFDLDRLDQWSEEDFFVPRLRPQMAP